jgi:hypothetical protein
MKRFPGIRIIERFAGPVANTVSVKVGPPDTTREDEIRKQVAEAVRDIEEECDKNPPPRRGLTTDPRDPRLKNIVPGGQQEAYLVLSEEERAKGFVRPVRRSYLHVKCGKTTTMGRELSETYARNPKFYNGTFCSHCGRHFPLVDGVIKDPDEQEVDEPQFFWVDQFGLATNEAVGS